MIVIWKFNIVAAPDGNHIEMPVGAKVLKVDTDFMNHPKIWVQVNTEAKTETRKFVVYGTGHEIQNPHNLEYIGTFQQKNFSLVWHVFEEVQ